MRCSQLAVRSLQVIVRVPLRFELASFQTEAQFMVQLALDCLS